MGALPSGTVTFLFADVEGSTQLLHRLGDGYRSLLTNLRRLLARVFEPAGGVLVDTQGDSVFYAFPSARAAVAAAVAVQRRIAGQEWPDGVEVRLRIGLHTGEAGQAETGYVGLDVHRAARLGAAAHGGQILVSEATRVLVEGADAEAEPRKQGGAQEISFRDLGEHRLKDLARPQHIFQVLAPGLRADFPQARTLDVLPHNLPVQLTSFIGREREMVEVERLLEASRSVTLTGAGGSGKTRLALQVAATVLERFPQGVWWVDFTPLSDPSRISQAVANTLGIREERGRSLTETLADYLRAKTALLLLDNCEHVIAGCAELAHALLTACPNVRILATSRERLGVPGEAAWRVPSLSLPEVRVGPLAERSPPERLSPSALAQFEAVRLFTERGAFAQPGFTLTERNAEAVERICRQLDGIPLALELAAARVSVLSPHQIADRLADRFALLAGTDRPTRPRHQTLQAAMDWSYDLLTEPERLLLARLSVFAGGFTLEAAEAICAGESIERGQVLNLLARLVDKSLVIPQTMDGEARFRLLETIREYARLKLETAGAAGEIRLRHRDWYLALSERAEPGIRGHDQAAWLERLDQEHDNLRAALTWSRDEDETAEAGLRLAAALWRFWDMHGYLTEGREWLEALLARPDRAPVGLRTRALNVAGVLAHRQGDYDSVPRLSGEALRLAQQEGDDWNAALALHHLAHAVQAGGDLSRAAAMMDESVGLFGRAGDRWGTALSLNCRGDIARNQDDNKRAAALFDEALRLWRDIGDRWGLSASLANLGWVMDHLGDARRAAALFKESLEIARELGLKVWVTLMLTATARTMADSDPQRAATLLGAVVGLYAAMGAVLEASERPDFERTAEIVRRRLGEEPFATAWQAGQGMTLERAVEFALAPARARVPAAEPTARRKPGDLLSPREREVAALVARGLSNRDIASLLVVTERTAETHVQHVMNKLGCNSRAQIAAWAVEQGLGTSSREA